MEAQRPFSYNPLLLDQDPYPVYRRLRDEAPLYAGRIATGPFWALSRFADVEAAARDWETFSSAQGNDLDDTGRLFGPAPAMDLADPPVHTRQRNVLRKAFTPRVVETKLEPLARHKIRELVGRLEQIPVMFEHSRHDERSSCILAG
jgi:cytochrome P450